MAIRTALINGNALNRDYDFSKYIETLSEPGVISGLAVSTTAVAIGKARVPCERTNGDKFYALVYNNTIQNISGDGEVYIQIKQEYIDDGELANEDGSGIAEIKVGTMPSKNCLKLASKLGETVTDQRNMIPKVGELGSSIDSLTTRMTEAEADIQALEERGTIARLEESGLIGELYDFTDKIFKQKTPNYSACIIDVNIGDINTNKQIHIQRIANGTASNQLKLKIKSVGEPTTGLVVEVRKGKQVNVVNNYEAYWYGGTETSDLICSGSISYTSITNSYQEFTVTMNGEFGAVRGELLDIVLYQTGDIVNSTNYYCVACDGTQHSDGFSYVAVNGDDRVRSKLMPYCISEGFADKMLSKISTSSWYVEESVTMTSTTIQEGQELFTAPESGYYHISGNCISSSTQGAINIGITRTGGQLISGVDTLYLDDYDTGVIDCIVYLNSGDKVKGHEEILSYGSGGGRDFSAQLYRYYDLPYGGQTGRGGLYEVINFSEWNESTGTQSYTTTKSYELLYLNLDWAQQSAGDYPGSGATIQLTVGGTTYFNTTLPALEGGSQTIRLTNISNGTVITLSYKAPSKGISPRSGITLYYDSNLSGKLVISADSTTTIRPLIVKEVRDIGKQVSMISYGRLEDGTRYGDFDGEVYTSATTGGITLGNCIGFKIIEDSTGFRYKIPIYGL